MYENHIPATIPANWKISELDEENECLEFLGFDDEFLVSLMKHKYDNPSAPYFLCLNQMKGILDRCDFENLEWPEWFENAEDGVDSAIKLMEWINQNYQNFLPVTQEVWVSLGSEDQRNQIEGYFSGDLQLHEFQGERLIFRKVSLSWGSLSYSEAAIETVFEFNKSSKIPANDLKAGFLTNERFQLIDDLRPTVLRQLKPVC